LAGWLSLALCGGALLILGWTFAGFACRLQLNNLDSFFAQRH
jgi:hypothetical protein